MTVSELIAELQKCDKDKVVYSYDGHEVGDIKVSEDDNAVYMMVEL